MKKNTSSDGLSVLMVYPVDVSSQYQYHAVVYYYIHIILCNMFDDTTY